MKHETLFERHGLFDSRVPRYTSYPPANRFGALDDGAPTLAWLAEIPAGSEISLYLHVPFCRRLCWFCACRTQGTRTDAPVENYVDHLIAEIDLYAHLLPRGVRIARIHFGGGTPTLLQPATIRRLLSAIDDAFDRVEGGEFSVEIDPTECDRDRLAAFRAHGMNRASIGVQDFHPRVQAAIGRQQGFDETQACIDDLHALGVDDVNIDILYGLPFQTEQTLGQTIDQVLTLGPSRLAAFGYAHVPWMSRRQVLIDADALPDPRQRLGLFQYMATRLEDAGFLQIGIDHFVRPMDGLARALAEHRLHRNFQGYTDDDCAVLLGLGASAISRFPQGYLQNSASTANYLKHIAAGEIASSRGITLTEEDKLIAVMIESLMCYGRIDLDRLDELPESQRPEARARLDSLALKFPQIVRRSGDAIHVDREHFPLLRVLAAGLDGHEVRGAAHSVAV